MSGANVCLYPFVPTDLTVIEDEVVRLDGEADAADVAVAQTTGRLNALVLEALDLHTEIEQTLAAVPSLKVIGMRAVAPILSVEVPHHADFLIDLCEVDPGNYLVGGIVYVTNAVGINMLSAALISVDQFNAVTQGGFSSETFDLVGGGVLPKTAFLNLSEVMPVAAPSRLRIIIKVDSENGSPSTLLGVDANTTRQTSIWVARVA